MSESSLIIAIETGTSANVAVVQADDGGILAVSDCSDSRSDDLPAAIHRAMTCAGRRIGDVAVVACSNSPGSSTGLRNGKSAALGLTSAIGAQFIETDLFGAIFALDDKVDAVMVAAGKKMFGSGGDREPHSSDTWTLNELRSDDDIKEFARRFSRIGTIRPSFDVLRDRFDLASSIESVFVIHELTSAGVIGISAANSFRLAAKR